MFRYLFVASSSLFIISVFLAFFFYEYFIAQPIPHPNTFNAFICTFTSLHRTPASIKSSITDIMGLFQAARKPPPTVPTDTIIPMHFFDDNAINRSVLLYITLRFDDILDSEQLRHGLERLMELGDWRKLGARLRMTVSNPRES
jgi:hypothetical protein